MYAYASGCVPVETTNQHCLSSRWLFTLCFQTFIAYVFILCAERSCYMCHFLEPVGFLFVLLFLSCRCPGLNLGHQAWQQAPLPLRHVAGSPLSSPRLGSHWILSQLAWLASLHLSAVGLRAQHCCWLFNRHGEESSQALTQHTRHFSVSHLFGPLMSFQFQFTSISLLHFVILSLWQAGNTKQNGWIPHPRQSNSTLTNATQCWWRQGSEAFK